jgi:archaellum component FlaF (FlaF/FlaG flagellin family)
MKKNVFTIVTVILAAFFIFSCTTSTSPEVEYNNIDGYLYDDSGHPIADAGILLSYNIDLEPQRPDVIIAFDLAEDSHVTIWITKQAQSDTILVFIDSMFIAGAYVYVWDGQDSEGIQVINGFYDCHLYANSNHSIHPILLNQTYYSETSGYHFNAVTDSDGFFSLPQADLPFNSENNEMDWYNEDGVYAGTVSVNRYISIWAMHPDYDNPVSLDYIYVYEDAPTEIELYFTQ